MRKATKPHQPPSSYPQIAYPFVHGVPFITVATIGIDHRQSAILGNFLSPSYVPTMFSIHRLPMSMWQRFKNTAIHFWIRFYWTTWAVALVQEEVSKHSMWSNLLVYFWVYCATQKTHVEFNTVGRLDWFVNHMLHLYTKILFKQLLRFQRSFRTYRHC